MRLLAILVSAIASAQTSSVQNVERILHFSDTTVQALPDVSRILRTIAGVRAASIDEDARTITVEVPADQSAAAEWLAHDLDQPLGQVLVPAIHDYGALPKVLWGERQKRVIKLFYPAHADTPGDLIEMIAAIRLLADVPLLEPYDPKRIVALAGPTEAMVLATWVFHDLDQPAARELTISAYKDPILVQGREDQVIRVFHFANARTKTLWDLAASIRNKTGARRVFAVYAPAAIVLRGTVTEAAQAENMVRQEDHPGLAQMQ